MASEEDRTGYFWLIGIVVLLVFFMAFCNDHPCDNFTGAEKVRCIDAYQGEVDDYENRIPGRG